MEFLSINEKSQEWNMSKRRIQILCKEGRIVGAKMIGNMWVIPENAEKPEDARKKNPIKNDNRGSYSGIRKDLKCVLRKLYKELLDKDIKEETIKKYILALLSVSLVKIYVKKLDDRSVFAMIYHDLNWDNYVPRYYETIQEGLDSFVQTYKNDREIDDIISWAYQYLNKIGQRGKYTNTQFFTEGYMTKYLVEKVEIGQDVKKVVDPCCGGGNFLVECLENIVSKVGYSQKNVINAASRLYGFDIDKDIAKLASVNIKIRCMSIISQNGEDASIDAWKLITPKIYCNSLVDIEGSLGDVNNIITNVLTGEHTSIYEGLCNADYVLTNPPYETIKGMNLELKNYLKLSYPDSNCDTCVAFILAIHKMLKTGGKCGIVSQNAWMYLKSFDKARRFILKNYSIKYIADLGSGAFLDLSGEKSNVALVLLQKGLEKKNKIKIADLKDLPLAKKSDMLLNNLEEYSFFSQADIDICCGFDYKSSEGLKLIAKKEETVSDVAVPMQGTSTGNAKELVGYFWEHFNDSNWVLVSNGGGYCRWQGLNHCVVKWGVNGEYIKQQKGSAIRNAKYFDVTNFVFSDTGTAGLNVRKKLENQIFIASGPGIRVNQGKPLAQLAYLNSRLATYYIRIMSPKLTIAAGYIARLPMSKEIYTSIVLEKNAELCLELKRDFLEKRPNNIEYSDLYLNSLQGNIYEVAYDLFMSDMENELMKLEIESHMDTYILSELGLSEEDKKNLEVQVGKCAFCINTIQDLEINKFDKYMASLLDNACVLKKTRISKTGIGCDGLLEYVAKDLNISPEHIVKSLQLNKKHIKHTIHKYCNLIIHNEILKLFGYSTVFGFQYSKIKVNKINNIIQKKYNVAFDAKKWIGEQFCEIHNNIFKGSPLIRCKEDYLEVIKNA